MKNSISTAALKRIITAQRGEGFFNWHLNFSRAQAREEGLTESQIKNAFEAFQQNHGVTVTKAEMIEVVRAHIA